MICRFLCFVAVKRKGQCGIYTTTGGIESGGWKRSQSDDNGREQIRASESELEPPASDREIKREVKEDHLNRTSWEIRRVHGRGFCNCREREEEEATAPLTQSQDRRFQMSLGQSIFGNLQFISQTLWTLGSVHFYSYRLKF